MYYFLCIFIMIIIMIFLKFNCEKIMKFFFYVTHLKSPVIIIFMENP